jgi:hypothetical protein
MNIKDGKVCVDMKIVGGKRIPLVEIVEKYKPFDLPISVLSIG